MASLSSAYVFAFVFIFFSSLIFTEHFSSFLVEEFLKRTREEPPIPSWIQKKQKRSQDFRKEKFVQEKISIQ